MSTFEYRIKGQVTCSEADTDDGFATVEIDEIVEIDEMSPEAAKERFFEQNAQYKFYGSLKTCDAETGGKKGATYKDQNEDQTIEVDLLEK